MHEVLDSVAPWIAVLAYVGFGYAAYTWLASRPSGQQLIPRPAILGVLVVGFVLVLVLLYLSYPGLQSESGVLSVFGLKERP